MVVAGVDKRTELIAKAVTIFSAKGFRGTSMNQIAAAGGIHKSTLYHYFTGKEELLVEIYGDVLGANVLAAERILASDQPTAVKLREMLVARVIYTCTNRRILQIFFEEEAELPKRLLTRVYEERKAYVSVMSGLIQQGVAEGIFAIDTNPTIVVNTFLGATNWIYKWYEPRGSRSPAELGEEITELLLRSIAAQ